MKLKFETFRIPKGNDTNICVKPVLPDGVTMVPATGIEGSVDAVWVECVAFIINDHEHVRTDWYIKDGYLIVPIDHTMEVGVYGLKVQGTIADTIDVEENRKALFEIVPYTNTIAYENYYTEMVIVGMPDGLAVELRRRLEEKIAHYQHLIDELNRNEVATKSDLGLEPGETVAGLIKAGGGGGGLTPEQWDKIAKEQTLNEIKGMLTLADGEVTTELQTLIPNEEETV